MQEKKSRILYVLKYLRQKSDEGNPVTTNNISEYLKGLENNTVYFVICNSLLKILSGIKNDYNKETNLLYVALTRTKSRLLFIVDDNKTMRQHFKKLDLDIEEVIQNNGISKADKAMWFNNSKTKHYPYNISL